MKTPLSLSLVATIFLGAPAFAQDLYRTFDCGNFYKNTDADASPAMKQKVYATFPTRTTAAGMIVTIGITNALRDMRRHREHQCKMRSAGKKFEAECPLGKTIFVDDYVNDALKQFADQGNGTLQSIMEQGLENASIEGQAMMDTCNDR